MHIIVLTPHKDSVSIRNNHYADYVLLLLVVCVIILLFLAEVNYTILLVKSF